MDFKELPNNIYVVTGGNLLKITRYIGVLPGYVGLNLIKPLRCPASVP